MSLLTNLLISPDEEKAVISDSEDIIFRDSAAPIPLDLRSSLSQHETSWHSGESSQSSLPYTRMQSLQKVFDQKFPGDYWKFKKFLG